MPVGILGGAYNPPHLGHMVCAQEALVELSLESVLLVPMGQPSHRQIEQDPGAPARFEMCKLAAGEHERLRPSPDEIERQGPSYNVDTLRSLEGELVLILGGDQAAALPSWREPEEVLRRATVAVVPRTGWPRERVEVKLAGLKGAERVQFFDMPRVDVSSTLVRRRVAEGKPIRYLVPDAVAGYIESNDLYRLPSSVSAER